MAGNQVASFPTCLIATDLRLGMKIASLFGRDTATFIASRWSLIASRWPKVAVCIHTLSLKGMAKLLLLI